MLVALLTKRPRFGGSQRSRCTQQSIDRFPGRNSRKDFKLVYAVRSERSESHRIPPFEQGKMTMGEYETKFRELSRYAPHLVAN